jgi:hypothetical protein
LALEVVSARLTRRRKIDDVDEIFISLKRWALAKLASYGPERDHFRTKKTARKVNREGQR